jgi:hypothetical protein
MILILLLWLSNNLTLFLELIITNEGFAWIFFVNYILKLLTFSERWIVVLIKWPTFVCLPLTSLGGITCLTLFIIIPITIRWVYLCLDFVDFGCLCLNSCLSPESFSFHQNFISLLYARTDPRTRLNWCWKKHLSHWIFLDKIFNEINIGILTLDFGLVFPRFHYIFLIFI